MAIVKVYRVIGMKSADELATEWDVMAYLDEGRATALAERLNAWLMANGLHDSQPARSGPSDGRMPPEDPGFRYDYNGASYRVDAIDVDLSPIDGAAIISARAVMP